MDCKSRDESNEPNQGVIRHYIATVNLQQTYANDGLIRLIRFVSQFTDEIYNQFCDQYTFNTSNVERFPSKIQNEAFPFELLQYKPTYYPTDAGVR